MDDPNQSDLEDDPGPWKGPFGIPHKWMFGCFKFFGAILATVGAIVAVIGLIGCFRGHVDAGFLVLAGFSSLSVGWGLVSNAISYRKSFEQHQKGSQ